MKRLVAAGIALLFLGVATMGFTGLGYRLFSPVTWNKLATTDSTSISLAALTGADTTNWVRLADYTKYFSNADGSLQSVDSVQVLAWRIRWTLPATDTLTLTLQSSMDGSNIYHAGSVNIVTPDTIVNMAAYSKFLTKYQLAAYQRWIAKNNLSLTGASVQGLNIAPVVRDR